MVPSPVESKAKKMSSRGTRHEWLGTRGGRGTRRSLTDEAIGRPWSLVVSVDDGAWGGWPLE